MATDKKPKELTALNWAKEQELDVQGFHGVKGSFTEDGFEKLKEKPILVVLRSDSPHTNVGNAFFNVSKLHVSSLSRKHFNHTVMIQVTQKEGNVIVNERKSNYRSNRKRLKDSYKSMKNPEVLNTPKPPDRNSRADAIEKAKTVGMNGITTSDSMPGVSK